MQITYLSHLWSLYTLQSWEYFVSVWCVNRARSEGRASRGSSIKISWKRLKDVRSRVWFMWHKSLGWFRNQSFSSFLSELRKTTQTMRPYYRRSFSGSNALDPLPPAPSFVVRVSVSRFGRPQMCYSLIKTNFFPLLGSFIIAVLVGRMS